MSFIVNAVKSVGRAVGNVVSGVVKAVGSIVSGVVKAVGSVVSSVINFVASPFMGLLGGMPSIPTDSGQAEAQQGVLVQRQGSNINIPVVYGYRKVAGTVVFAETGSTNNRYLWVAYVFSEGPVEGVREVYIDDQLLPADTAGKINAGQIVDITDTTSKYAGRVRLQGFPGVFNATPSASTVGATSICKDAPSWKPTMHYNGMAVIFARYEWKQIVTQDDANNNPFGGGIPTLSVCLLGRRVAALTGNPENHTYGGSGYTERYSTNPAEILLDYLRNPRYGKGLSNSEIDWDSFKVAAAKCATQVTYLNSNNIRGPILTCNYVVDTGISIFNNVKILLQNMRGYLPYSNGRYKLKIEDAGNPTDITSGVATIVRTFNKNNIQGDITYTGIDRASKYNQVVVTYVDPDQKWSNQQVVFPEDEATRLTFQLADGGRENKCEITFPCITNYAIAKDFARLIFNKSRYADTCTLTVSSEAFNLETGDCVYVDANILKFGTDPNFQAIPWRIISIKLNNDFTHTIGLVRNPDFMYPYTRVGEIDLVLPPFIPNGVTIQGPAGGISPPVGLVPPNSAPWWVAPTPADPAVYPPTVVVPGGTGSGGGTNGAAGTATVTASIAGNIMYVTAVSSGTLQTGMFLNGTGVTVNTGLSAFLQNPVGSPTPIVAGQVANGGIGAYRVDKTQTVSSTTITASLTPIAVAPPTPVYTPPTDVVTIDNLVYSTEGVSAYITATFKQPDNGAFSALAIYYKRAVATEIYWGTALSTLTPGAGQNITVKVGPLVPGSVYDIRTKVLYKDGTASTVGRQYQWTASTSINGDPVDGAPVNVSGWSAMNTSTPVENYDAKAVHFGTPLSTRTVTGGVRYLQINNYAHDILNSPASSNIIGVNVYYKPSNTSNYNVKQVLFSTNYVAGTKVNFDLGVALGASGAYKFYDFVIRFAYAGTTKENIFQYVRTQVNVEDFTDPFAANTQGTNNVNATAQALTLVQPGSGSTPQSLTGLAVASTFGSSSQANTAIITVTPPNSTQDPNGYFKGLYVYYRPVISGQNPAQTLLEVDPIPQPNPGVYQFRLTGITMAQEYEVALVPKVINGTGFDRTTNCLYGRSFWLGNATERKDQFNFQLRPSSDVITSLSKPYPATRDTAGAILPTQWSRIAISTNATSVTANNFYYQLRFQRSGIVDYAGVTIYRRTRLNASSNTPYYGFGWWERITITDSTHAPDANGIVTVNLRAPIQINEFNANFSGTPNSTAPLFNGLISTTWQTFKLISLNPPNDQFFVVINFTDSTSSTRGCLLPSLNLAGNTTGSALDTDLRLAQTNAQNLADYNTAFVNGYKKRLDESRAALTTNLSGSGLISNNYVAPTVTPSIL